MSVSQTLNPADLKEIDIHQNEEGELKKKIPANGSEAFDILLESVGNKGKWQLQTAVFLAVMGIFTAFHNLGAIFLGATPDYECDNPYLPKDLAGNLLLNEELANFTTPWIVDNKGVAALSKCHYFNRSSELIHSSPEPSFANIDGTASSIGSDKKNIYNYNVSDDGPLLLHLLPPEEWDENPEEIACSKWIYNKTVFHSTVVTEWNLVCDRTYLKPIIQGTYMLGILTGAVVASGLSDRFGRRPALLGSCFLFVSCSLITVFSTSLTMFLVFRFILGAAGQGTTLIKFVITVESSGKDHRTFYGIIQGLGWSVGFFFLFVESYFIRGWRYLQLGLTVPMFILITMYWIIPESPRWLLMKGRFEDGLSVLEKIGKTNGGKSLPPKEELDLYINIIKEDVLQSKKSAVSCSESMKEFLHNVYLLVKTPNMRRRNLIMFYSWFVVSMNYYGAAFSGENIGVSLHTMTAIGALTGFPAALMHNYSVKWFGRRGTFSYTSFVAAACLIGIIFVPSSMGMLNMILAITARMFLGVVFYSAFFFSTELVPTNIRNISIGISSMWARIGSAIGPFIVDLGGSVYYALPSTVFGGLSLIAGFLALLLPDTSKQILPETIDEIELMPK